MKSLHLVDPAFHPIMSTIAKFDYSSADVAQVRASMTSASLARKGVEDPDIIVEDVDAVADGHSVSVRIYRPRQAGRPMPALLAIHAGGFIFGAVERNDEFNARIAREMGCFVAAVRYRLAPETPFPGAIEDCYAALKWLDAQIGERGLAAGRLVVLGTSAGGGLAASIGLLARDRGEVTITAQILLSPMLDDRTCITKDINPFVGEFVWNQDANRLGWRSWLGQEPGVGEVPPYAVPARAETLGGLPPTYISTSTLDLFLEEDIEFARRLMHCGVPTELHVYPGVFHGFMRLVPDAQVSRAAQRDLDNALRRALGTSTGADQ